MHNRSPLIINFYLVQVTAIDADDAESGSVRYSLYDGFSSKDDNPFFHINSVTGEICVSQDIDHEAGRVTFDLLIKAEDQVSSSLLILVLWNFI